MLKMTGLRSEGAPCLEWDQAGADVAAWQHALGASEPESYDRH